MNISTEVRDCVIIFHDGAKQFVSAAQAETILRQSTQPGARGITVNASYISFGSISKILTIEEFYSQFPSEIPEKPKEYNAEWPDRTDQEWDTYFARMKTGIIRGLQRYCDESPTHQHATGLLEEFKSGKLHPKDFSL
jgi:hypothetical protein|tara:strand:- start:312 stop:725 length:414 start_codon:yes stop_codon:yes gene_type:complete